MKDINEKEAKNLIQEAKGGKATAFGLIYDAYFPRIYRFIFLKVGNQADAEDLAQQVFIKSWEAVGRFEEEGLPVASWFYRIARNIVIDFYRTRKHYSALEEDTLTGNLHERMEERISLAQAGEEITKALAQLTEEQREIIILRFVEDLSYREIAKIVGKNQPALRILQHRALGKLKKIIEKKKFI